MKKIYRLSLLAASLLVASTTTFAVTNYKGDAVTYKDYKDAAPCPQPLMLRDGFYVGGQLGYDSYRLRVNTDVTTPDGSTFTSNPVYNATGWVGGLFLGYGQYFNMGYLGLEIFGNDSGASASQTSTFTPVGAGGSLSLNSSVNVNGSYGISLLPGIKLNDATLGYIRLGWNRARIHTSATATETLPPVTSSVSGSANNWVSGFNYGLGLETAFYDQWSVRTEFTHTNYGSFSSGSGVSTNPSDNQFMLGLIYHFA